MRKKPNQERFTTSCANGIRSGIISTCFAVSPIFGAGAVGWAFSIVWGSFFARKHNQKLRESVTTTEATYLLFLEDCRTALPGFAAFALESETMRHFEDQDVEADVLNGGYKVHKTANILLEEPNFSFASLESFSTFATDYPI